MPFIGAAPDWPWFSTLLFDGFKLDENGTIWGWSMNTQRWWIPYPHRLPVQPIGRPYNTEPISATFEAAPDAKEDEDT